MDPETLKPFTTAKPKLGLEEYGFGFAIEDGGAVYGHDGGFTGVDTGFEIYRESGFVVVILANQSDVAIRRRVSTVMRQLIERTQ